MERRALELNTGEAWIETDALACDLVKQDIHTTFTERPERMLVDKKHIFESE